MASPDLTPQIFGRYALYGEIASGGMATIHVGALLGAAGFTRTVAIKRLHPHLARDPEFVAMFLDEARLAARIRHANVVPIVDVVTTSGEILLVMDFIPGEALSRLLAARPGESNRPPDGIVSRIVIDALHGLHAAHEARSERGIPLRIVHRDVSPQNILVGVDGISRIIDFGVAKAAIRIQSTQQGQIKGKIPYMAAEQLIGQPVDHRADLYSAGVTLWELLAGQRLFVDRDVSTMYDIISGKILPPSAVDPSVSSDVDHVVLKSVALEPGDRYQTALEMAEALERVLPPAASPQVARWVQEHAKDSLAHFTDLVRELETGSGLGRGMKVQAGGIPGDADLATDVQDAMDSPASTARSRTSTAAAPKPQSEPATGDAVSTSSRNARVPKPRSPARKAATVVSAIAGVALLVGSGVAIGMASRTPSSPPSAAAVAVPSVASLASSSVVPNPDAVVSAAHATSAPPPPSSSPSQSASGLPPPSASGAAGPATVPRPPTTATGTHKRKDRGF